MMGLVALVTHRNLRISGRDAAVLGLLAVMYAATSLGLLRSYDYIPSGVATTVNFLYPLVVAIVMALFFRERSSSSPSSSRWWAWPCWRGAMPDIGTPRAD